MSHHLDSPLARQDVRLDITDLYVFSGEEGTVFVLNINNSIAGVEAPKGFHPEGQYAIKLDLDGDAVADLTYRLTFGERDTGGSQSVSLRRLTGRDAAHPDSLGTVLAEGTTGAVITGTVGGVRLWAGGASEPFYIDPTVLHSVGSAFKAGTRADLSTWSPDQAKNLFANTSVNAIVLEIPDTEFTGRLRPDKRIFVWATTMLATDAGGWRPINRAGHPMIQPIFNPDDTEEASHYNTTEPADDPANYSARFAGLVAAVVAAYGSAASPQAYGESVANLLLPDMLPYQIGSEATYSFARHNGRALTDNTPDVMFSLVTNTAFNGGLSRSSMTESVSSMFPYVASPMK